MSGYSVLFYATKAYFDSQKRQIAGQIRKCVELFSKAGNADSPTKLEQTSLKISELESRNEKLERQIKLQNQRLDALKNTVQARIKADSR